jgi:hypothetical protein
LKLYKDFSFAEARDWTHSLERVSQALFQLLSHYVFKNHSLRASKVAQTVEHLPGKCEALSSNHSVTKKEKKKNHSPGFLREKYIFF